MSHLLFDGSGHSPEKKGCWKGKEGKGRERKGCCLDVFGLIVMSWYCVCFHVLPILLRQLETPSAHHELERISFRRPPNNMVTLKGTPKPNQNRLLTVSDVYSV